MLLMQKNWVAPEEHFTPNDCVFDVRNGDLRRSVRYKKRKKPTQTSAKDRSYRQGHNYENFQNYMKDHPDINVVEMDSRDQ